MYECGFDVLHHDSLTAHRLAIPALKHCLCRLSEQISAGVVEKVFHLFDVALRMQFLQLNAQAGASAAATYANEISAEVQRR